MKILSALLAITLLGAGVRAFGAESQTDRDQQQMATLTREIQTQQAAIADNQKKIDEKTAAIAEALRLARIYASRGR